MRLERSHGCSQRRTQVVVSEPHFSVAGDVGIPVGNGLDPLGEPAGGKYLRSKRRSERSKHGDGVRKREREYSVRDGGQRRGLGSWRLSHSGFPTIEHVQGTARDAYIFSIFAFCDPCTLLHPPSSNSTLCKMSSTERTYIMVKVRASDVPHYSPDLTVFGFQAGRCPARPRRQHHRPL